MQAKICKIDNRKKPLRDFGIIRLIILVLEARDRTPLRKVPTALQSVDRQDNVDWARADRKCVLEKGSQLLPI